MKTLLATLSIAVLAFPGRADADILGWFVDLDCSKPDQTKLRVHVSGDAFDFDANTSLYGCGGTCGGPALLADQITWENHETHCACMGPGGGDPPVDGVCPEDNYVKCGASASVTLPFSCDQLGYEKICVEPRCTEEWDLTCSAFQLPASFDSTPRSCVEEDVGCSISPTAANASLLGLLLGAFALSLLWSRRRRG